MKAFICFVLFGSAQALSFFSLFNSRAQAPSEAADAVASWALASDVPIRETSPTALAVVSRLQERLPIVAFSATPCMRDATVLTFISPCVSASELELRAFALAVTNCHLAASGRRTYAKAQDMDEGAFNAYTLFYSNARDICTEMQSSVVAAQQELLARELTVVAHKTAAEMAGVREGFVAMGAVLQANQAAIEKAAVDARVGFEELAAQGSKAIKENRDGFQSVSAQAAELHSQVRNMVKETHEQLQLVARGSAEASAKTEELARHLLQAHEIQRQLLQTQQNNLEAMGRAVDQAFGSTTYLVAMAWYSAASVVVVVLTAFGVTSHARAPALTFLVMTGLCEFAMRTTAISIIMDGYISYLRIAGAASAISSIAAITIWRATTGRLLVDDDEERFIRILARYLACKA